jgi:hypothetical protein
MLKWFRLEWKWNGLDKAEKLILLLFDLKWAPDILAGLIINCMNCRDDGDGAR